MKSSAFTLLMVAMLLLATAYPTGFSIANPQKGDSLSFSYEFLNMASEDFESSRLDCYVKVIYSELQFIKAPEKSFRALYRTDVEVFTMDGKQVDKQTLNDEAIIDNLKLSSSTSRFRLNKLTFRLPPGGYRVVVRVEDLETNHKSEISEAVVLQDFSAQKMSASGILLLDDFVTVGSENTFRPRVSDEQNHQKKLFAYFEVYNVPSADSFTVQYEILDADKNVVQSESYRDISSGRRNPNVVELAGDVLQHGQYLMTLTVRSGDDTATQETTFNWYVEGLPLSFTNIEQAIEVLKYIASKEELKRLKKTPKKDKYSEFVAFWKTHDPTPETAENELRREYYKRISYANEHYNVMRRDGWKTDMGWVYVMLGPPDTIEREPYNQNFAPYPGKTVKAIEVWIYYKYNRRFVFFDENGFGEYQLVNPETLYEILK